MIGVKYNKLEAIKEIGVDKSRRKLYLFKCDCGHERVAAAIDVRANRVKSCGCLLRKHGKSGTSIYGVWSHMIERCYNVRVMSYSNYGGRGIKVCDRWKNSFENFYKDMGDKPSAKHQLDRIDNDGNYEPNNCRWVNRSENSLNKRHPKDSNPHKNVYLKNGKYFVQIKRMQKIVRSKMFDNLDDAISDRERLLKSYDENPECWGAIK